MGVAEQPSLEPIMQNLNKNVSHAYSSLKHFCVEINTATQRKRQIPKDKLLDAMKSVMYPLLQMKAFEKFSIDEVIRLGLLVFSSHVFLNWQGIKPPNSHLPRLYRNCLLQLKLPNELAPQVLLWLLMVGAIVVFSPADDVWLRPWIRVNIEMCGVGDWTELHNQLKMFPWIDNLHDGPGRVIYDAALS